jgi:hypothetical protein
MAGVTPWSYKIAVFTLYDPPLLFIGTCILLIILILSSCSLFHLTMYFSLNLGSSQVKKIYIDFAYTYDQGIINL